MQTTLAVKGTISDDYHDDAFFYSAQRLQTRIGTNLVAVIERLGGKAVVDLRYEENHHDSICYPKTEVVLRAIISTPQDHLPESPSRYRGYPAVWVCGKCGLLTQEDRCPECNTPRSVYR
jgi:rubrerythrin